MNKRQQTYLLLAVSSLLLILSFGATRGNEGPDKKELKGVFLGKSYKAKLISVQVGGRTLLVSYNEETEGLDEVEKGDNVLLRYMGRGDKKEALEISTERAALPDRVTEIEGDEVLAMVNDKSRVGKYLLVDCRPADFYAETHLPTAVSIPWTESKDVKLAALPANKDKLLIFYCLGTTCLLGPNSAAMAVGAGYTNVKVLFTELSEWQESGGRLYSADQYVAGGNVVLVDLRSRREAEDGHIPGAVSISANDISEAEYDFPTKKSAPVVVYSKDGSQTGAIEIIKGWGFHQVSMVKGGYEGWVKRGNPVSRGEVTSTIKWQRRLGEGEVSIEEFKKVVAGEEGDAVVVDVRNAVEADKGSFAKAINIPLSDFAARLADVPVDKKIYLHCATGSRAKMAWTFLKQHRGQVRYLQAKVICTKGVCRIRP